MKRLFIRRILAFVLAGVVSGYAGSAYSAGFAVNTPSAQGMGNAFAGGGAVAEDASAVWLNPASITRLPSQAMTSAHVILPTFEFNDRGSTQSGVTPLLPSAPSTNDGGQEAFVPNFYYIRTLNERLSFGLAVNAPFGLATEYDRNWKGRYHAVESEIIDFNINPALAYKVTDSLSVGAGVSLNYIDAKLTNAVDFAAICAATVMAAACPNGAVPGQGSFDGFVENEADDISYGFNLGIFIEPNEGTRFSLAYRSQINHKLEGDADFTAPTTLGGFAALGPVLGGGLSSTFSDDGISAGVSLPDTASFSVYQKITSQIALMGDITWTGWSDIPELLIVFDNPSTAGGPGSELLEWEDTWRFSFGANYYASDRITLRTGIAYDESPVQGPNLATPRLPDNDRLWVAVGASYLVSDKLSVDFGYAHEFINDTNIARANGTGAILNGVYESDADIISLQVSYIFD